MMKRFFPLLILLVVPVLVRADDGKAVFSAGIFMSDANRSFTAVDREKLAAKFPGLPILTGKKPDKTPDQFMMVRELAINASNAPTVNELTYRGHGLSDEQQKRLANAKSAWIILFAAPKEKAISNAHRGDQMLAMLADLAGGIIYDDTTRGYYAPQWWHDKRLADWQDDVPRIADCVAIDYYKNGESFRCVSLGMEKFGLPNLVINQMIQHDSKSLGNMMNMVMQRLAEGQTITPAKGGSPAMLALDLDAIKHDGVRKAILAELSDKATKKLDITLADARRDEGDPPGPLLELTFANFSGGPSERHEAAVAQLFGAKDSIVNVKHDKELLDAVDRAKAKLPAVRRHFDNGLGLNERLIVKGPFKTTKGGNEWMWVEVKSWPAGKVKGILINDPFDVPALKAGAEVTVNEADIFDYVLYDGDKVVDGGETIQIMQKREGQ